MLVSTARGLRQEKLIDESELRLAAGSSPTLLEAPACLECDGWFPMGNKLANW